MEDQTTQATGETGAINTPLPEQVLQGVDIDEVLGLKLQPATSEADDDVDIEQILADVQKQVEGETDEAKKQASEKQVSKASKRFTDLVAQRKAAEAETERLRHENQVLSNLVKKTTDTQNTSETAPVKPKAEAFEHGKLDAGYLEALADYSEKLIEHQQKQFEARFAAAQEQNAQSAIGAVNEQRVKETLLTEGKAKYQDYATLPNEYKFGLAQMFGTDVAYHVAKDTGLQERLRALPSREAVLIALGELKGRMEAGQKLKGLTTKTNAQPPITPVQAVGNGKNKSVEEMTVSEQVAYRRKFGWV